MALVAESSSQDSGLVLRLLTAILLSGAALLGAAGGSEIASLPLLAIGLAGLWASLALVALLRSDRLRHRGLALLLICSELTAIGCVVGSMPAALGLPVFFLGPVTVAAARLGREGALAAATLAALVLLLPAIWRAGAQSPLPTTTGVGAVLLLGAGLVAGELVRLVERRRQVAVVAGSQARRAGREVQMILDNLGSGFLAIDRGGFVTRLNPRGRALLDLNEGQCSGSHLQDLLAPGGEALAELVLQALADGRPRQRCEVSIRRRGAETPLGLNVDILSGEDGALEGAVAVFNDLTEVKRLQAQLRRSDRLAGVGELAASIAHELRNPLASIRGSVELLAGELEVQGHQAQLMELILRESARLNTIITDFLAFARLRPAHLQPLELDSFLPQVVLQLRQHVNAQGGRIEVSCACETAGLIVCADAEQLVQAFLNLGLNACEAMRYSGTLRLSAAVRGDQCELRVRDTGPGLDLARVEEIFTPFVTTKAQGTGLGLPMVARIVHGHGGSVEAGNSPGGGAEIVMRLPLAAGAQGRANDRMAAGRFETQSRPTVPC